MQKQLLKRDWEMVRIFLILAVLTAGFVWAVQSLILTPVTIGHNPGYKSPHSMPSGRVLHKDAVRADILGTPSGVESLFLQEGQLPERFPTSFPKRKLMSSEAEDLHTPHDPPQLGYDQP